MNALMGLLKNKCPQCRQGDIFKKPFKPSNPNEVLEYCPVCNMKYEPEPGYFYGAMFISYIWTSFVCLAITALFMLVLKWSMMQSIIGLLVVVAISYIWVLRISRVMYLYLDRRYDPSKIPSKKNDN